MKRAFLLIAAILLSCSLLMGNGAVMISPQDVYVDGNKQDMRVYNIDGYNHFKLRDLAYILNGTDKQFSVEWNEEEKLIYITSGEEYTAVGGELSTSEKDESASALENKQDVNVNGTVSTYKVYNIGGYNYFGVRDLARTLNFYVALNMETHAVEITTTEPYGGD